MYYIYSITCIVTGEKYFGLTTRANGRKGAHYAQMRRKSHNCKQMAEDFHQYGEKDMVWGIVEFHRGKQKAIAREKELIDSHLIAGNCYNRPIIRGFLINSKKGMEDMSKIFINLDNDELHKKVKIFAAKNNISIKEVVKNALIEYMKSQKKEKMA